MEKVLLSLESPRWSELEHAYGHASDTPSLLMQLAEHPDSSDDKEPWFTLWISLAHQGDVYSASFAAVPHVVQAIALSPLNNRGQTTVFLSRRGKPGSVPIGSPLHSNMCLGVTRQSTGPARKTG